MLPEGWYITKLGKISELITSGSRDWAKYYSERGAKFVRMTNLSRDAIQLKLDDMKYVEIKSDSADGKRTSLQHGDILISITAELGKIGWVPHGFGEAYINQHTALVRLKRGEAEPKFVAYLLSSKQMNKVFNKMNDSGAKAGLNLTNIRELSLCLPPLSEQTKITQILFTWDLAIEVAEKLLQNCKLQKIALMQQLLSGKKRMHNFSGKWSVVPLKSVLIEEKSRNKDKSVQRVLSVTNHSGFILPEEQFSKRVASIDVSNYKVIKKGQFAYNPSRINVGSFARLDDHDVGIVSPMYVVFGVKNNVLSSNYFLTWMSSNEAKQRVLSSTQGTVRDSVSFDALCGFPFKLPPIDEQNKINEVILTANLQVDKLQQYIDCLKQEKRYLMQYLLSGKLLVKLSFNKFNTAST